MSSFLVVPIHLDALVLNTEEPLVEATADFSVLPYIEGGQVFNPDTANVSADVVSPPFQNQNLYLKRGVHLHWALPDTLTKAVAPAQATGDPDAALPSKAQHSQSPRFPVVPNRWLIVRTTAAQQPQAWIVESDCVYPAGEGELTGSINYPWPHAANSAQRPYRRLGRKLPATAWPASGEADYLCDYPDNKLTAVGYGEPTFAAFYPNCCSVFGFHDDDDDVHDSREYDVIGWYSAAEDDILTGFSSVRSSCFPDQLAADLEAQLHWQVVDKSGARITPADFPDRIICYAHIKVETNAAHPNSALQSSPCEIAIGQTGTEALAAYLASKTPLDDKAAVENQLDELLLSKHLKRQQLDRIARLQEARHERGFKGVHGGRLWTLRSLTTTEGQITLPVELADELNQLNLVQQAYDRLQAELLSLRRQLFADWYKYMLSAYPPDDSRDDYPDIDEVRFFIERRDVAAVRQKQTDGTQLGQQLDAAYDALASQLDDFNHAHMQIAKNTLLAQFDDPVAGQVWNYLQSPAVGWLKPVPGDVARAWITVTDQSTQLPDQFTGTDNVVYTVTGLNATVGSVLTNNALPVYALKRGAGPRYWQPTEPAVLITGVVAQPTDRHGQTGALACGVMPAVALDPSLVDHLADIQQCLPGDYMSDTCSERPWNPIMLEWEVEVHPARQGSNLDPERGAYAPDFLAANNYRLDVNQPDFSIDAVTAIKAACVYSGRTILTPHAHSQLDKTLTAYLSENLLNLYCHGNNLTPPAADQLADWLSTAKPGLAAWYDARAIWNMLLSDDVQWLKPITGDAAYAQISTQRKSSQLAQPYAGLESTVQAILNALPYSGSPPVLALDDFRQTFEADLSWIVVRAFFTLRDINSLSQSLGGFNAALLMQHQVLQLPIEEPLGFPAYQSFTQVVAQIIQAESRSAPQPLNDFTPIRSGLITLRRLRLIDTFGQIFDVPLNYTTPIVRSEALTAPTAQNQAALLPRLTQPARLNFRWLSAESDLQEMNDHPNTTPICGWVLPNNLDHSLMIYDAGGQMLGQMTKDGWQTRPGTPPIDSSAIKNAHLNQLVQNLLNLQKQFPPAEKSSGFIGDFVGALDDALTNIEPENFAQQPALALLMGRPLAVVRATLSLEVQGLPALNESWDAFRQDLARSIRDDDAFSQVIFPVRLGENRRLNDGLIGYWFDVDGGQTFYTPQAADSPNDLIKTNGVDNHDSDQLLIPLTLQAAPVTLTMLIDPRGAIHATSGILPVKAISLPPDQYLPALRNINITFKTGPLLTEIGEIDLPLPSEPGYTWSWLQKDADTWTEVQAALTLEQSVFVQHFDDAVPALVVWNYLLSVGWLKADPTNTDRAWIVPKDQRPTLRDTFIGSDKKNYTVTGLGAKVQTIFDLYAKGVRPVNTTAAFTGPQEIREGWLKLSPTNDSSIAVKGT